MNQKKLTKLGFIYVYFIIGLIMVINYPKSSDVILNQNYIVNTLAYFFMTGLFLIIFFKNRLDIFDPIFLFSIIYITMFSIVPNYDIAIGEILWFGVYLFEYGIRGTSFATLGYLVFCFTYTVHINRKPKKKIIFIERTEIYNKSLIAFLSLTLWIICLILSVVYLVLSGGMNLAYIFTLGVAGSVSPSILTPIGVISLFSYSLIPLSLVYNKYGKSKIVKIFLFVVTLLIQMIRGFRFIAIILILAYGVFYYLSVGRRPSGKSILSILIILAFLTGIMGFYRGDVRAGNEIDWDTFSTEDVNESIIGNFRIYKTYYGIIKAVPNLTSYTYGEQMFVYTLVLFIPRAIWPEKPSPPGTQAIELGISDYALKAGQAYPFIGEYYKEFGLLGILFFMGIFGYFMRYIKTKYLYNKSDPFGLMVYSILLPTTFQIMIRGYTPSNFYLVIFLVLPVLIIKYCSRSRLLKLVKEEK
ncbi:oligosaccharide repeat unit polymerase [Neobacillus niacini]|nr:oligosaccharide repeat unit polymerase [Neobacillus niacini]